MLNRITLLKISMLMRFSSVKEAVPTKQRSSLSLNGVIGPLWQDQFLNVLKRPKSNRVNVRKANTSDWSFIFHTTIQSPLSDA